MKYRLIEAESVPITLYYVPVTKNGIVGYNHSMRLEPGEIYETDDAAQINYLKEKTTDMKYNASLIDLLDRTGADYEVVLCKSCGGKVKKIRYHNIEVLEDE